MVEITASMLYDHVNCPHRVAMDQFADQSKRDAVSPFIQLLWERGLAHEREVVSSLGQEFLDLSGVPEKEKERQTLDAMRHRVALIYNGRLRADDLLGVPDFLRLEDDGYIAGDIKSGAGEEGGSDDDDSKPKVHYAVQVALYTDILERLGFSKERRAFILDVHGEEIAYQLDATYGVKNPRTLWDDYQECLAEVRQTLAGMTTLPAYSSGCKNCVWYSACLGTLEASNDLTLIPFLGRSLRDTIHSTISTVADLAAANPDSFIIEKGKKTIFRGLGPDRLKKFHARAKLLSTSGAKAYLSSEVALPLSDRELFFDIEVDPMRDICYLHGFVERSAGDNDSERFFAFFADSPTAEAEQQAFASAWNYMQQRQPSTIYYYSKYERTIYRKLQAKYPGVCSAMDIEELFDPARSVDLYFDVVLKATEWPTRDFSIKTLAKHLGFSWRDTHPSGAASIEWFHRWVETKDQSIKSRILEYNEDDCRATRVLLDGIRALAN